MIFLCRIEELARTSATGVVLGEGAESLDIVIVEKNDVRYAYINSCPHQFIPLETFPDHFLADDREHLICSGHGALFEIASGHCVEGPCQGEHLDRLAIVEKDGAIFLDEPLAPTEIARQKNAKRNW